MMLYAACNVMLQISDDEFLLFYDLFDDITNGDNAG
jgi:hypothetical protein